MDAPLSKFVEDLKARQQGSPLARDGAAIQARSSGGSGGGSRSHTVPQLPTISETLTLSLEVPEQVSHTRLLCAWTLCKIRLEVLRQGAPQRWSFVLIGPQYRRPQL